MAALRRLLLSVVLLTVLVLSVFSPINSPFVEKVEVVRKGRVRRAKLTYLRNRTGKAAKVKRTAPISFTKGTMYIVLFSLYRSE